ncbi:hypothetical protein TcBrA4_0124110 [Trypanosoma cruzi]|nr:hypothetical protein TcBrA4_0124110 [Trypanosoma cruzi]
MTATTTTATTTKVMLGAKYNELRDYLRTPLGLIIFYVFMNSLSTSIWMRNAWTPLIYQVFGNSNLYVGFMAALNGTSQMLCAILGGHLSDKVLGPSLTLISALRFGTFSLLFNLVSVWISNVYILMVAQVLYGSYLGVSITSVESVFAQCIKHGERDRVYGVKFSFESSGPVGGLVITLILFALFGNAWRVEVLRWVITAGIVLHVTSIQVFLAFFRPLPSHADGNPDNACTVEASEMDAPGEYEKEESRSPHIDEEIYVCTAEVVATSVPGTPETTKPKADRQFPNASQLESSVEERNKKRGFLTLITIPLEKYPYVVALADLVVTVGSGMTTQYFPLFMMNIYFISPMGLSTLGLLIALLISLLAIVNSHLGSKIGRARAIFLPKLMGTFILLYMALARGTSVGPKWLMCIAYVLRMSLMNSTLALSRALIMDFVSEKRRGMWSAVESIQTASWSGTALVGGYVADKLGYGAAFIVTFGFHLTACTMLLPCTVKNDTVAAAKASKEDPMSEDSEMTHAHKTIQGSPVSSSDDGVVVQNMDIHEEEQIIIA